MTLHSYFETALTMSDFSGRFGSLFGTCVGCSWEMNETLFGTYFDMFITFFQHIIAENFIHKDKCKLVARITTKC